MIVGLKSQKVKNLLSNYIIGLTITLGKKNCVSIAQFLGIYHDSIYRFLSQSISFSHIFPQIMLAIVSHFSKHSKGWFIIDDTCIGKPYAKLLEGLALIYNSCLGHSEKGYSLVILCWSNGNITIPIAFQWWFPKELLSKKDYQTKIELARNLFTTYIPKVDISHVLFDGLYCSKKLLRFLNEHLIPFECRIASNRRVKINNIEAPLKEHPHLKIQRNQRSRTVIGTWDGILLSLTIHKRKGRDGEYMYVYQASNRNLPSQEHIKSYEQRWEIEKMFRTMKQYLGLLQCQSKAIEKQQAHICGVFLAYAFLQFEKHKQKDSNAENVIKRLRIIKTDIVRMRFTLFSQVFAHVA